MGNARNLCRILHLCKRAVLRPVVQNGLCIVGADTGQGAQSVCIGCVQFHLRIRCQLLCVRQCLRRLRLQRHCTPERQHSTDPCGGKTQQQELFACLPDTPGVGVAVQMQDGTTRVLRMSNALERHLRQEWTPYLLANAADIHPEQVLRVLLYQDSKSVPLISLAEKAIGDRVALLGERIAPDTLVLTPKRISGREMLDTVCTMAQVGAEQVLVLAGGQPMLELVQAVEHSAVAADAPAELRLAAGQVTLTDAAGGAAVEVLYRMVRAAEKSV